MFITHLHLLLNHVPVISLFFALAFFVFGKLLQNKSWLALGSGFILFAGFSIILVFLTGHGAEDFIEKSTFFNHSHFETHEEAGNLAFIATLIAAATVLLQLVLNFFDRKPRTLPLIIFLLALLSFGLNARAGYYGGKIRHNELFPQDSLLPTSLE